MPIPIRSSRRAFLGMPAVFSYASRASEAPTPSVRDFSYGPSSSQRLDVYAAPQESRLPAPVVVMIHGGGWVSGSRRDVAKFIPNFTSQRYVEPHLGQRFVVTKSSGF